MEFSTVSFQKKTYDEIIKKYNIICAKIKNAEIEIKNTYSQNAPEDNIILQEALQKNKAYLEVLDFVCKSFNENTCEHPDKATEEELQRIYTEIEKQYKEETHDLYIETKYNPVNCPTYAKKKKWKVRVYGWILGIPQNKTDYASNYFHKHRIYDAINNLHKLSYFYAAEKDNKYSTYEVNKDFNLLMDFTKSIFNSK